MQQEKDTLSCIFGIGILHLTICRAKNANLFEYIPKKINKKSTTFIFPLIFRPE